MSRKVIKDGNIICPGNHENIIFECTWDGCGKIFKNHNLKSDHIIAIHRKKPFGCKFCDYSSTHRSTRDSHQKRCPQNSYK